MSFFGAGEARKRGVSARDTVWPKERLIPLNEVNNTIELSKRSNFQMFSADAALL